MALEVGTLQPGSLGMRLLTASALSRLHTCDNAQRSLMCRYGSMASKSSSGRSRTAVLASTLALLSLAKQMGEAPAIFLPFLSTHSLRCCCGGCTMVAIGSVCLAQIYPESLCHSWRSPPSQNRH